MKSLKNFSVGRKIRQAFLFAMVLIIMSSVGTIYAEPPFQTDANLDYNANPRYGSVSLEARFSNDPCLVVL